MTCLHCGEALLPTEDHRDGLHIECIARLTLGSIGHQMHQCPCYGGTVEDPPNFTKRQAARAAYMCGALAHTRRKQAERN
jgi:hypothetical protein